MVGVEMISRRKFINKTMIGSIDIVFPNFKFIDSKIDLFLIKYIYTLSNSWYIQHITEIYLRK